MNSDGSEKTNITEGTVVSEGFIGNPVWYIDGEHIVFQAESEHSEHRFLNHMAWGINNDLWIITKEGKDPELIYSTEINHGALHAHFNSEGNIIIFAERTATGVTYDWIEELNLGAGGENQWAGWSVHIADFDINKTGKEKLSNHRSITPNGPGFYETHTITDDKKIIYSFTPDGQGYVDDIYICNYDGSDPVNLINNPKSWEEHGNYSPSGKALAFLSNRFDKNWEAPGSKTDALRLELYLKKDDEIIKLTDHNSEMDENIRYLVSDFSWNKDGDEILYQVAPMKGIDALSPQIWLLKFDEPQ
jgi:Tol biopolymer transport system component